MNEREQRNQKRIEELYKELSDCYSNTGCNHEKATTILNGIIERKKHLIANSSISPYVDFKRMLHHYVKSMEQKERDYDEINIAQIEKKIQDFLPDQRLHLYDLFRRELILNGYSEQAEELRFGIDVSKLEVYSKKKGLKVFFQWLSIRVSYKTRYLIFMLTASFLLLNIILLPNPNCALFVFHQENISQNFILNHIGNVLFYLMDIDSDIELKPLNFGGVLLMVLGKTLFILFVLNFVVKKILDKLIK